LKERRDEIRQEEQKKFPGGSEGIKPVTGGEGGTEPAQADERMTRFPKRKKRRDREALRGNPENTLLVKCSRSERKGTDKCLFVDRI